MAGITLHQQDINDILDTVAKLQQQRVLMNRLGRAIHTETLLNFRRGVAPDGTPWRQLKGPPLGYRKKKGKPAEPGQPLRDNGRLQRSIGWEATDTTATIGTNVVYARAHNEGTSKGLPQRQFLGLAPPQYAIINRIADKWIEGILNGA